MVLSWQTETLPGRAEKAEISTFARPEIYKMLGTGFSIIFLFNFPDSHIKIAMLKLKNNLSQILFKIVFYDYP